MHLSKDTWLKVQENFRWVTPVMLGILTGTIMIFISIVNGYSSDLCRLEDRVNNFDDRFVPRHEVVSYLESINKSLSRIESELIGYREYMMKSVP